MKNNIEIHIRHATGTIIRNLGGVEFSHAVHVGRQTAAAEGLIDWSIEVVQSQDNAMEHAMRTTVGPTPKLIHRIGE